MRPMENIVYFTCFFDVNVSLKNNWAGDCESGTKCQNSSPKLHQTRFLFETKETKPKKKTCCAVVVQYAALTLTIINIHETATLRPLRMVKLIMLTGSFNCFIQSKQFSCNKWHNNYAHNLTRGQWRVEEWHTHLHKVQRMPSYARTHTTNKPKK